MEWTLTDDADRFLAAAGGFLRESPASNTVALTVLEDMRVHGPGLYDDMLFGWWTEGRRVGGAFLRTGGHPPQLSRMPEGAARELADVLTDRGATVAGAGGWKNATEAFADAWTRRTGAQSRVVMRQRLYRLGELVLPDPPPEGAARTAGEGDRALTLEWAAGFAREAGDGAAVNTTMLDSRLTAGRVVLWEVRGRPVAMAWWSPVVAGMSRVSGVYTPGGHRRRGYGAAVTAEASRAAQKAGATEVVLFTDLANPTSNSVYQRLGYRPVEDRTMLTFTGPTG